MAKNQRLVALDFLKIIAMSMMIMGHSFFDIANPKFYDVNVFPWNVWFFFRGLTAPIFLFISGFVQVFANKRDENGNLLPNTLYKRIRTALLLLFIGYSLNFPARRAFDIFFIDKSYLSFFYQVNILHLFGVLLLLLVLLYKLTRNNRTLGYISLAFSILVIALNAWVHLVDWFKILPSFIASYLSLKGGSYFPFFPFAAFFFIGVAFATYIQNYPPEVHYEKIFHSAIKVAFVLLPIGVSIYPVINIFDLPFYDLFKANPGMSIIRFSLTLIILCFVVFLFNRFPKLNQLNRFITTLGKNALFIYLFHLLILYGLPWYGGIVSILGLKLGIIQSFILSFLIMILSFVTVFIFEEINRRIKLFSTVFKFGSISLAILLLLI